VTGPPARGPGSDCRHRDGHCHRARAVTVTVARSRSRCPLGLLVIRASVAGPAAPRRRPLGYKVAVNRVATGMTVAADSERPGPRQAQAIWQCRRLGQLGPGVARASYSPSWSPDTAPLNAARNIAMLARCSRLGLINQSIAPLSTDRG
jgi:hypothetical protein